MAKKGLITIGLGAAGIALSFLSPWGPCAPATLFGVLFFFGGGLAVLIGVGMSVLGVILRLARQG
jgi:hypothetical protein